ncbi:MAG: zf-HC2 domain-containing protein [Anaerolineae bacterium]
MHLDDQTLRRLVDGRLHEKEQEQIMAHLAECGECVDKVDALWAAQPLGTAVGETEPLDPATARRVEKKVVKRIHRSDLTGEMLRLLVQGFAGVAVALARPLVDRPQKRNK